MVAIENYYRDLHGFLIRIEIIHHYCFLEINYCASLLFLYFMCYIYREKLCLICCLSEAYMFQELLYPGNSVLMLLEKPFILFLGGTFLHLKYHKTLPQTYSFDRLSSKWQNTKSTHKNQQFSIH